MTQIFPAMVLLMAGAMLVHSSAIPANPVPQTASPAAVTSSTPSGVPGAAPTEGAGLHSFEPSHRAWGPVVNNLQCSLEVVPAPTDQKGSAGSPAAPTPLAFSIHLRNAGETPISLLNLPADDIGMWGPLLLRFEFRSAAGQPVTGVTCESLDNALTLHGATAAILPPGKEIEFLALPSTWITGQQFNLEEDEYQPEPPLPRGAGGALSAVQGKSYQVRVTYEGAGPAVKAWPKGAGSTCWQGEVQSGWVSFHHADPPAQQAPRLVWGPIVNGLRAAIEMSPDRDAYIVGDHAGIRFRVQNVGRGPVSFTTTTWRQDDPATVTDEHGAVSTLTGAWFTGWPLQVRYTLPVGKSVALDSPDFGFARDGVQTKAMQGTVGKILIAKPGRYALRYTLQFPDLQRTTPDGKPVPSDPGAWTGTLQTGIRPVTLLNGPVYPVFGPIKERPLTGPAARSVARLGQGPAVVLALALFNGNAAFPLNSGLALGADGHSVLAIRMAIAPAKESAWSLSPEGVVDAVARTEVQSSVQLPNGGKGAASATFFFKTPDGRAGVLEVKGSQEGPLQVRIKRVYSDTAWGKAVGGLQGGVRFADGPHSARIGDTVNLDYYIRNAGVNALEVSYPSPGLLWGGNPPHVSDEEGGALPVSNGAITSIRSLTYSVTLQPGETYRMGQRGFGIRAMGWNGSESNATLCAKPGQYRLSQPLYVNVAPIMAGHDAGPSHPVALNSAELELPVLPPSRLQSLKTLIASAPPIIHTGAPSWGPVVNGLQAGLSLDLGDRPYAFNENVSFTVHLKNVSDHPVQLALEYPSFVEWTVNVRDAAGHPAFVLYPLFAFPVQVLNRWLAVGETVDIPGLRLDVRTALSPAAAADLTRNGPASPTVDPTLHAPAGEYQVTYSCRFLPHGSNNWAGTIIAGPVGVKVVGR